jgi:pimeloyl-ACP methyl ester carboxylesterase
MGGAALVLAEVRRPGTLSKIWTFEPILFDGTPDDTPTDPSPISEAARHRRPSFESRDEAFDRYGSRPPLSALDERALRAYVDHGFVDQPDGSVTLACRPEDEAEIFERHYSGVRGLVSDLTVPFLAAASGEDFLPAQQVIEAAELFPNMELARYPELNHFGPLQAPEALAADLLEWLDH